MTGLGIHAWFLTLLGIRSAFVHQEIAAALEIAHVLGNSYRMACSGTVSGAVCSRFAMTLCNTAVAGHVDDLAARRKLRRDGVFETIVPSVDEYEAAA
jgi:hypothetical protein